MANEGSLSSRYLARFKVGVGLLLILAVPAIVHSHAAIESLLNQPADWVPNSLPEKAEYNEFSQRFSVAGIVFLSWPGAELDSPELDAVAAAIHPLCEDSFDPDLDAEALAELPKPARDAIGQIREIAKSKTPFKWVRSGTELLQRMTGNPARLSRRAAVSRLRGCMVGPNGKQTCLVLSLADSGTKKRRLIFPHLRDMVGEMQGLQRGEVALVGSPFDGAVVDDSSIRSIQRYSPPSAIVAAILCFLCLRSFWLTAVITAIAVIGEGIVLAIVYYTGTPMNAVLIVLPPLVFVLTVSSGIHLSNYYLDASHEFSDLTSAGAARRAMRAGTVPCLLATTTTVIGLGSLMLVRLEPIRVFGFVASLGVLSTLLLMLLVLPGAMVLTKVKSRDTRYVSQEMSREKKWLRTRMRSRLSRPWPVIAAFILIGVICTSGLFRLTTTVSVPRMFESESDIRKSYAWYEQNVGPTVTGELVLTFPAMTDDEDAIDRLKVVKQAHLAAYQMDNVDGVLSAVSFVPAIPKRRGLAASAARGAIRKLIRDPASSLGQLDFIARHGQQESWRLSIRMPQGDDTDFGAEIAKIRREMTEELSDSEIPVDVTLTGHVAIVQKAQQVLLRDLFRSFLTAFAIVAVVMMVVLRSVVGGLLAMMPNLFPTVALFGVMGLSRSPLDIGSVMTASVALGIAVDGTIHLLSRYGSRRERGFGQIRATFGALGQCGWAMFQTTLVCGLALMCYWFSDFVPTSRFALLMFGLLCAALIGDVLLLPAMMASPMGKFLARTVGNDPGASLSTDQPGGAQPRDVRRIPSGWRRMKTDR